MVVSAALIEGATATDSAMELQRWLCELIPLPAQRRHLLACLGLGSMIYRCFDCQWCPHLVGPRGCGKSTLFELLASVTPDLVRMTTLPELCADDAEMRRRTAATLIDACIVVMWWMRRKSPRVPMSRPSRALRPRMFCNLAHQAESQPGSFTLAS